MSGETGQLQRLTDEQVNARLAAYNAGGSLDRDIAASSRECRRPHRRRSRRRSSARNAPTRYAPVYAGKVDAELDPAASPNMAARSIATRHPVPDLHGGTTEIAGRVIGKSSSDSPTIPSKLGECVTAFQRIEIDRDRHHSGAGCAARSDRSRRIARPRERPVRAPRRRAGPRQHRAVEVADRAHPLDRRFGARNARQDQRSRRRRRAVGGRDARSRADRRRPHPRHRGRPFARSRSPPASRPAPATRRARR